MACRNKEENNMDSKVSPNERQFVCVMIYLLRDSKTMLKVCDDALRLKNRSRRYEATLHHLGKESKQLKGAVLNTLDKQLKATSKVKGLNLLHFSKGIIKIWLLCFHRLRIVSNLVGKKKKNSTQTMLWYVVQYIRKAICLRGWQVNALTHLDESQDYRSKTQALILQLAVKCCE